jgi:hypothetical protein
VRRVAKKPSKALTTAITRVINRKAESKMAMFYGTAGTFPQSGIYNDRGYSQQNQFITSTTSDLKWLLPNVAQGSDDAQRIGDQITPTLLRINGCVKVANSLLIASPPQAIDVIAVIYVLTHKVFKSYEALLGSPAVPPAVGFVGGNNFNQLLKNGENITTDFSGNFWAAQQPVANQYYNVIAKIQKRLRFAGLYTSSGASVSIANSHDYQANFTVNLTQKDLPAHLKYPESTVTGAFNDAPLNFAPFLCVGYYNADGTNTATPQVAIDITYTSTLFYKDM